MAPIGERTCECGCGNPAPIAQRTNTRFGHKKGEQIRFINGHSGGLVAAGHQVEDRGYDTPCWIWLGGRSTNGKYGRMQWNGKMAPAHRAYWEARNCRRVPDGYEVDHLCRVTPCVNPDHLEPVTPSENRRRAGVEKLNAETVAELRQRWNALPRYPKSGRVPYGTRTALAREYGIDPRHLAKVVRGLVWAA